jgi:hypothetical protein
MGGSLSAGNGILAGRLDWITMRAFIFASLIALVIAIAAAVALDGIVQEPSSTAFSTSAVRLSE